MDDKADKLAMLDVRLGHLWSVVRRLQLCLKTSKYKRIGGSPYVVNAGPNGPYSGETYRFRSVESVASIIEPAEYIGQVYREIAATSVAYVLPPATFAGIVGRSRTATGVYSTFPPSAYSGAASRSRAASASAVVIGSGGSVVVGVGTASRRKTVNGGYVPYVGVAYPARWTCWYDESILIAGSGLTQFQDVNQRYDTFTFTTSDANADETTNGFFLAAGEYIFSVLGITASNRGIVRWYVDNVAIGADQDWYSAGATFNVVKTITFTLATSGFHVLRGLTVGKNASSSSYRISLTKMWFRQASDPQIVPS